MLVSGARHNGLTYVYTAKWSPQVLESGAIAFSATLLATSNYTIGYYQLRSPCCIQYPQDLWLEVYIFRQPICPELPTDIFFLLLSPAFHFERFYRKAGIKQWTLMHTSLRINPSVSTRQDPHLSCNIPSNCWCQRRHWGRTGCPCIR